MLTYKGYIVSRNCLTRAWYADPINDATTEGRLRATNGPALKALIDADLACATPDPWELRRAAKRLHRTLVGIQAEMPA
jgi:hypothetical protein